MKMPQGKPNAAPRRKMAADIEGPVPMGTGPLSTAGDHLGRPGRARGQVRSETGASGPTRLQAEMPFSMACVDE